MSITTATKIVAHLDLQLWLLQRQVTARMLTDKIRQSLQVQCIQGRVSSTNSFYSDFFDQRVLIPQPTTYRRNQILPTNFSNDFACFTLVKQKGSWAVAREIQVDHISPKQSAPFFSIHAPRQSAQRSFCDYRAEKGLNWDFLAKMKCFSALEVTGQQRSGHLSRIGCFTTQWLLTVVYCGPSLACP